MSNKKCCRCKEIKDLSEFYKNKNMKDGHGNYCRSCTKSSSKQYYQKKQKYPENENSDIVKMMLLNNFTNENVDNKNVRIVMIEKLCYAILDELKKLKKDLENKVEAI